MVAVRGFDVLRQVEKAPLGGRPSAARERLRAQAIALARDESLIAAAFSYRIVPLRAPAAPLLQVGGESLEAPWLLPASGELTALACCVCTLGPQFERRVSHLFAQRLPSLALALDELGNQALFEISRRAQDRIQSEVTRQGLTMSGELRAGDPGLALDAQAAVLRLAHADSIGVSVGESLLMRPLKSVSMVLGVGVDLPASAWSRCDACPSRERCGARSRALAAAALA
jgi:hypothetical protein